MSLSSNAVPFTGRLAGAGAVTMWISMGAGAVALAWGPWARIWIAQAGCGLAQIARLVVTGALTAWFIFVLAGALVQALAEDACTDAFALAAHISVCVETVRALMAIDQRGLAFLAYACAAYLTNLVPDARVTLNLVFFGAIALVASIDGGPGHGSVPALSAPERAGVAGVIGAVLAMAFGCGFLATAQSVVRIVDLRTSTAHTQSGIIAALRGKARTSPAPEDAQRLLPAKAPDSAKAAQSHRHRDITGANTLQEIFEGAPRAGSDRPAAYGDSAVHVFVFTLAGGLVANMTAWIAYQQGALSATRGWPELVRGDPVDTWAATVPGLAAGTVWFFLGPALVHAVRVATTRERDAASPRARPDPYDDSDRTHMDMGHM